MKMFTVEQANRTLPLLRRIVADIVATYPRWQERVTEIELIAGVSTASNPDARLEPLEREAQALAAEIAGYIREIEDVGAEYRMPADAGLVDFPGEIAGRHIFLCWRMGEHAVGYWHDVDAGFAGRQPLIPQAVG
ncbi:MAG: DUF2203 domain-containing protein [Gemmatimonadaceae bacterium]